MKKPSLKIVPSLETLEDRSLLATAVLSSSVLTVYGTNANDSIYVRQINGRISVSGTSIRYGSTYYSSLSATLINKIRVYGYNGNDAIRCDSENFSGQQAISKPIEAYGGLHNDTIRGSSGNDTIWGNAGNDAVYGRYGNDYISGQEGDDVVDGWYGNDTLFGYTGNDTIYGGYGNDQLSGWTGNDYMSGWYGNDKLFGHGGRDTLLGGAGDDYLHGGPDNDLIGGGSGNDTFRRSLSMPGFSLSQPVLDDENAPADEPTQVAGAFLSDANPPMRDSFWDVEQQNTPTCAFLSALAAVSDWTGDFPQFGNANKDLLSPEFLKYDVNSDQYGVLLHVGGSWKRYWVNGDWTEYTNPAGPLWVTIYQKAYLRAMGVATHWPDGTPKPSANWYSTTNAAWKQAGTALKALTGYNSSFVGNSSMTAQAMQNRLRAGDMLTASSYNSVSSSVIIGDHSYHVRDIYTESGNWVVLLYNPWGRDTRTGAQYGADDGLIKISWSTFKQHFQGYYWA